ncbi:hypothetical protein LJ655_25115 [Paraburkholderia sp. MMS20-SJTN17]|uniref:Uncharacterized protein n=1 Tax=Paraburkholderia translucens TaxID=2886945 RepID=A0ABS8KL39_9BURK|nr:hypothetical protein [Paraburkholderia sp. MMS20-SJTN17]MCC8405119.1 hypothetical protein [Paraburkholderia sp. MMS20-SJTN17]
MDAGARSEVSQSGILRLASSEIDLPLRNIWSTRVGAKSRHTHQSSLNDDSAGVLTGRTGAANGLVSFRGYFCWMRKSSKSTFKMPSVLLTMQRQRERLLSRAMQIGCSWLHYAPYLLLHFPVLGALKSALLIWLICRLYPDHIDVQRTSDSAGLRLTPREIALCVVLGLSLLCYSTDFWHGVSPAWVSLGAGVACLLPQTKIVSVREFTEQMHVTPLLYVAGFLAGC